MLFRTAVSIGLGLLIQTDQIPISFPHPPSASAATTVTIDEAAISTLQSGLTANDDGDYVTASTKLTTAIRIWSESLAPGDETAALYRQRGVAREGLKEFSGALSDYDSAASLYERKDGDARERADPAEVFRTYLSRARMERGAARNADALRDYDVAVSLLEDLPAILKTNPQLYASRAEVKRSLNDWEGAYEDLLEAEMEYKDIGDKIRSKLAASESALAQYEVDPKESMERLEVVSRTKSNAVTNNPDDVPLLQELSRFEAESRLAYAADLGVDSSKIVRSGKVGSLADRQWETGCIKLEVYVQDAKERRATAEKSAMETDNLSPELRLKQIQARLNGMAPDSPYVTEQTGQRYFWYQVDGEGSNKRRVEGVELANVDARLGCARFKDTDWVVRERPGWGPKLRERLRLFVEEGGGDIGPTVIPKKGVSETTWKY